MHVLKKLCLIGTLYLRGSEFSSTSLASGLASVLTWSVLASVVAIGKEERGGFWGSVLCQEREKERE